MNNFFHRANSSTFFMRTMSRIICSRCVISAMGLALERFFFVLNLGGRFRGGLAFWRGRVLSGGVGQQRGGWVDAQQGGGAKCGAFGQAAAGLGLAECLPAHAKRSGGAGGGGVEGSKSGKDGWHGALSVNKARGRVIVTRGGVAVQYRLTLCQLVVDGSKIGQLHLPIAAA